MGQLNPISGNLRMDGGYRVDRVYVSPSLHLFKFRLSAGQRLFLQSEVDELQGKMSLLVLGGSGEFEGEEMRRYFLETGDIVVSEMSEQNSLLATSELSLLVTVVPYQPHHQGPSENLEWPHRILTGAKPHK